MIRDALIQYDNYYDSNTIFTQQINKFLYLKSYLSNTHVGFLFITRILYYLDIRVDFLQLFIIPLPP